MHPLLKNALAIAGATLAASAGASITFYENADFSGRGFTADASVRRFADYGFNDRASSVYVTREPWEVCEDDGFRGHCVVLRPGRYASLQAMGLNNRLSSARAVSWNAQVPQDRYGPPPVDAHDYHRHGSERLYQADVVEAHAVVGPPEQRCWVERQQVVQTQSGGINQSNAVVGAVIGGILGHQLGGNGNRSIGTVGGAAVGAAVGANIDRGPDGQRVVNRDVQRCTQVPRDARPEYWDVTYVFRGETHHLQTTTPPQRTVTVNWQGEPRN